MEPQTFVFFGQVGSGKGTQAKLLMDYLKKKDGKEQVYVSTGEEYRKIITSGSYTSTLIKDSLEQGALLPDFLTTSMFINILVNSLTPEKHLITDGYPRTISQSEALSEMMKFYGRSLVKIINIEVEREEAVKRMMLRGRTDDTKEGIEKRFDEYVNNVLPAMEYLKGKEGFEFYSIYGEQSVEEVHNEIIKTLGF